MISKDKTYRTRDGREVRIYATDGVGSCAIHGAVLSEEVKGVRSNQPGKEWCVTVWSPEGKHIAVHFDLIEVKPRHKRTVWLNVYGEHISVHEEKYHADASITINSWVGGTLDRIACIKVDLDFEEGEGL